MSIDDTLDPKEIFDTLKEIDIDKLKPDSARSSLELLLKGVILKYPIKSSLILGAALTMTYLASDKVEAFVDKTASAVVFPIEEIIHNYGRGKNPKADMQELFFQEKFEEVRLLVDHDNYSEAKNTIEQLEEMIANQGFLSPARTLLQEVKKYEETVIDIELNKRKEILRKRNVSLAVEQFKTINGLLAKFDYQNAIIGWNYLIKTLRAQGSNSIMEELEIYEGAPFEDLFDSHESKMKSARNKTIHKPVYAFSSIFGDMTALEFNFRIQADNLRKSFGRHYTLTSTDDLKKLAKYNVELEEIELMSNKQLPNAPKLHDQLAGLDEALDERIVQHTIRYLTLRVKPFQKPTIDVGNPDYDKEWFAYQRRLVRTYESEISKLKNLVSNDSFLRKKIETAANLILSMEQLTLKTYVDNPVIQ